MGIADTNKSGLNFKRFSSLRVEITYEAICKVLYATSVDSLNGGEKLSILVNSRRFLRAWGRRSNRAEEVPNFLSTDGIMVFALNTNSVARVQGPEFKSPSIYSNKQPFIPANLNVVE